MFKYLFIFALSVASLTSCKDHNTVVIKDDLGRVSEKYQVNNSSVKNGVYEAFYSNGNIKEKCFYKDGNLSGERTLFFRSGDKEITENYTDGVIDGKYTVYYEGGKVKLEQNFDMGELTGMSTKYHENGQLAEEVQFDNGQENGPFKEYHENGKVHWEGAYLNGENEVGLLMEYNEEGELIKKMQCDSLSVCRTIWTKDKGDIVPEY